MRKWEEIKKLIEATEPGGVVQLSKEEQGAYQDRISQLQAQRKCDHIGYLVPYTQAFGVRKYNISSLTREPDDIGILDYESGPASDACSLLTTSVICAKCKTVICLPNPEMEGESCGN